MVVGNKVDASALLLNLNSPKDEPLQKMNQKNPLLFSPVIRCVLGFLNYKEIKNCRFVCREWGSTGKLILASRALVHLHSYKISEIVRSPVDFQSCFPDSASLFSSFTILANFTTSPCFEGESWKIEVLTKFFDKHQNYIKELTLDLRNFDDIIGTNMNIDMSCWISKSPMVQKDAKYLTKLVITSNAKFVHIPLSLVAHIKELTLDDCRINVESGIKISPIKLTLTNNSFVQDGIPLDRVRINDIVDFCRAKEISLDCWGRGTPKYVVDLKGRIILDKLKLQNCEIVNGRTSQWIIQQMKIIRIPVSLSSRMQIDELFLAGVGTVDLFTLPTSIQNLVLDDNVIGTFVICSQPIVLENLQYLSVSIGTNYSFLSHFMNCPQLTHLNLEGSMGTTVVKELKSLWMPKSVKTLTLNNTLINWVDDNYLILEKLVLDDYRHASELCKSKIRVDDVVFRHWTSIESENLVEVLEIRNGFSFCKRFYIGKVTWDNEQLEDGDLKNYIDEKSSFYVFENGEKGRVISEKEFDDIIPDYPEMYYL